MTGAPLAQDDRKQVGTSWATSSLCRRSRGPRRLAAASLCPKAAPRSASSSACAMSAGARRPMAPKRGEARAASPAIAAADAGARRDHDRRRGLTRRQVGAAFKSTRSAPIALLTAARSRLGQAPSRSLDMLAASRARPAPSRPGAGSETMRAPGIRQNRACATRRRAPRRSGCPGRHRRHAPTAWAGVSATTSRRPFSAAEFDKAKKAPPPS